MRGLGRVIYVREDTYKRVRDMIIRYNFQNPGEVVDFLLFVASRRKLNKDLEMYRKTRGLI